MVINLHNRSFLKLLDFEPAEILYLLNLSAELKFSKKNKTEKQYLKGKNIVLIFEKTSTRTRCAFEVACYDQAAQVTYLDSAGSQIGHKETMKDTARVLGRMYDGIQYRGYGQNVVEELAKYSCVPVWNGLTNEFHPTQILGDFLTMMEHFGPDLKKVKFAYLGDAKNNVGNSLLVGAAKMGMDFRIAAPKECQPSAELIATCMKIATTTGAKLSIGDSVADAVKNVDFIYTDVWLSMGEPEDAWKKRIELLYPYQINSSVIKQTENPNVRLLHCLPAFHNRNTKIGEKIFQLYGIENMEVTEDVFESKNSIVFDQAENRLHTIKAIMVATLIDNSTL